MPEMVRLIRWLESHIPAGDDNPANTRISHGDYRCAHCSFLLLLLLFMNNKTEQNSRPGSEVHSIV